jgi:hypothetical protein
MLESKEIISIIFKVINFAVIAWIIKYVFQNHILPGIKEKLAGKFAFFRRLEDKNKDLIIQNELLEKEIKDQDNLFELLKEKISTWNQEIKKQKETVLSEAQKINILHKKRVEIQTQNIHSQKLLSEIFPRVLPELLSNWNKNLGRNKKLKNFLET